MAAYRQRTSGVFLHAAGQGSQRRGHGEHAAGRIVAHGRAPAVHLPQGSILSRYMGWPDAKKAYVAEFRSNEYQVDKAGTREALFGFEEPMEEPASGRPVQDDLIARVGSWGAVTRR